MKIFILLNHIKEAYDRPLFIIRNTVLFNASSFDIQGQEEHRFQILYTLHEKDKEVQKCFG
jgi:hypothetical protein